MAEPQVTLTDSAADGPREEPYSGRTAWARNLAAPVRDFLRTETGGAAVLLATTGCFVSHTTKEREVPTASDATSGAGRRCGNEICTPDRRCVEGHSGYFHCE